MFSTIVHISLSARKNHKIAFGLSQSLPFFGGTVGRGYYSIQQNSSFHVRPSVAAAPDACMFLCTFFTFSACFSYIIHRLSSVQHSRNAFCVSWNLSCTFTRTFVSSCKCLCSPSRAADCDHCGHCLHPPICWCRLMLTSLTPLSPKNTWTLHGRTLMACLTASQNT